MLPKTQLRPAKSVSGRTFFRSYFPLPITILTIHDSEGAMLRSVSAIRRLPAHSQNTTKKYATQGNPATRRRRLHRLKAWLPFLTFLLGVATTWLKLAHDQKQTEIQVMGEFIRLIEHFDSADDKDREIACKIPKRPPRR